MNYFRKYIFQKEYLEFKSNLSVEQLVSNFSKYVEPQVHEFGVTFLLKKYDKVYSGKLNNLQFKIIRNSRTNPCLPIINGEFFNNSNHSSIKIAISPLIEATVFNFCFILFLIFSLICFFMQKLSFGLDFMKEMNLLLILFINPIFIIKTIFSYLFFKSEVEITKDYFNKISSDFYYI